MVEFAGPPGNREPGTCDHRCVTRTALARSARSQLRTVVGIVALAACAAAAGCSSADSSAEPPAKVSPTQSGPYRGHEFPTPHAKPSFTLTDTHGRPYDFAARTDGHPTLLWFGYTRCPDICPTTMADVAEAISEVPMPVQREVRVVMVTTDPAYDKPAVLGRWLHNFDGNLPVAFVGLTGTKAQVETVQRLAGVPVAEDEGKQHSTQLTLYGPDDVARVFYLTGDPPSDLSTDLPKIAAKE